VLTRGRWRLVRHLDLLNRKLLAVTAGDLLRLCVFLPPRHGKSELLSHWFPTWLIGNFPEQRVILASYEASFAASWGRKVRDSLVEARQQSVFSTRLRSDVSAASEWQTEGYNGGMVTAGVGGAITGRGGNILLIDDPVKNAEEANSETYREKAWEWFCTTAFTRLEPGGAAILIQTRWHQDDLGGRIERGMSGEEFGGIPWEVVRIPALALEGDPLGRPEGEALWPARYPLEALEAIRAQIGSYAFQALYQGSPTPREGAAFRRQWFQIVDAAPVGATRVRFWDRGATKAGDPTVGVRMSRNGTGRFYIEDVRRMQGTPLEIEQLVRQTAELDGREVPVWMEQEPGSSGVDTIDHYLRHVLAGFSFRGQRSTGDKLTRADPLAAQAEAGNVLLVRGSWNEAFLEELANFPFGEYDDQVDGASGAFSKLSESKPWWADEAYLQTLVPQTTS